MPLVNSPFVGYRKTAEGKFVVIEDDIVKGQFEAESEAVEFAAAVGSRREGF